MLARLISLPATLRAGGWKPENGQSLIEYQILVGFLAVVCIAGITLFGSQIAALFNTITGAI